MSGVVGPDSSVTISVNFKPLEEMNKNQQHHDTHLTENGENFERKFPLNQMFLCVFFFLKIACFFLMYPFWKAVGTILRLELARRS